MTPVVRRRERVDQCALSRGHVKAQRMTVVMSWILRLQGRCTIKSVAKFLASMFAGVAPDLVCHGFPLQPAQYPLEPELESELESSISL